MTRRQFTHRGPL